MAKYRINVPIKRLMDSMLIPEEGLLENPFFEVGKKKKKKKKWENILIEIT